MFLVFFHCYHFVGHLFNDSKQLPVLPECERFPSVILSHYFNKYLDFLAFILAKRVGGAKCRVSLRCRAEGARSAGGANLDQGFYRERLLHGMLCKTAGYFYESVLFFRAS